MIEQTLLLKMSSPELTDNTTSRLRQEYQAYQRLYQAQSTLIQQYLNTQAGAIADAISNRLSQVTFKLPDAVVCGPMQGDWLENENVPIGSREQTVRSPLVHFYRPDLRTVLSQRLIELERSENRAISISAGLVRYATTLHMINNLLPAGRAVIYEETDGNDIPNQPVEQDLHINSAIASSVDMQSTVDSMETERGELLVPYVESARLFFLPQWVAFDKNGELLLNSVNEAEANIASMQNYLSILQSAIVIAPYMITDDVCQQKRYGMLGQLVNQGRALAHYQSKSIIRTVQRRVAEHKLDRGLKLSLPYFNDQRLAIENYDFVVIPVGRIMFIPAFVVLAVREQQAKVADNRYLSFTTRKHLLAELHDFEIAFSR